MTQAPKPEAEYHVVPVDENWNAPTLFVDQIAGFSVGLNGMVKFNLVHDLLQTPALGPGEQATTQPPHRQVCARVQMHILQFLATRDWFVDLVQKLEEQGVFRQLNISNVATNTNTIIKHTSS